MILEDEVLGERGLTHGVRLGQENSTAPGTVQTETNSSRFIPLNPFASDFSLEGFSPFVKY